MQLEIPQEETQRDNSNRQGLVSKLCNIGIDLSRRALERVQTKDYWANVFSGWTYYTPAYLVQEMVAGKDADSIMATRAIGLATHLILMDPIQKRRKRIAQKRSVIKESSYWSQIAVNVEAITPIQSAAYAAMLLGGMAVSGEWNSEATFYSWLGGTLLGAFHATIQGPYQDWLRGKYGLEKSIK